MNSPYLHDLRLLLQRWRIEHTQVADEASAANLRRMRWLGPVVVGINALHALVFLVLTLQAAPGDPHTRWKLGLFLIHTGMGLALLLCTWGAYRLRHQQRSLSGRWLELVSAATILGFAIAIVCVDQWITPSITPFLMASLGVSLALYLRPLPATCLYVAAYLGYYVALGWTQADPEVLLSNRMNGITACIMGWALSALLWRKHVTIAMQRRQLEKAHSDLQDKQRELERLTRQDGLTGLFNRNTFVELSRSELLRAQRQGSATTILLLDLDHFKRVNDTWGHPAGDAVLRQVATLAAQTVRSTDLVGRLGGEEFIVLLPHTSEEAGRKIAEKLRQRLEATRVVWEGIHIPVTASFGVASAPAAAKRDFDSLYTDADKALYLAKQRGRNRVV
ncbi:GGDEF domain-containing protein [Rhodoferax bucti]|uniref:GGDEF domain-containing protein n=1 Tax=Rhodoferax bucti TaxID=2576305 RepID=UPI0011085DE1|nr:GGDEF domain-containing protein [Rhodoferax bucti]